MGSTDTGPALEYEFLSLLDAMLQIDTVNSSLSRLTLHVPSHSHLDKVFLLDDTVGTQMGTEKLDA